MSDLDGVVRIGTEIDDSGFKKGMQNLGKTAEKELDSTQKELKSTEKRVDDLGDAATSAGKDLNKFGKKLDGAADDAKDFSNQIDKSSKGLYNFGSFLSAGLITSGITSLVSGFVSAVAESEEFTKSLSRLEINAQTAGNSFENIKDRFTDFIALTGQADSSAEALSNLLQTGFDDAGITQAVEALSGAVVQFPDTLNIESLADGLQETLATGTATGQFGELLDRLGIGAENFSTQLAGVTSEAEKQQLVLDTLASAGLNDVYQQYEEANSATLQFKESQAELDMAMSNFVTGTLPYLGSGLGTVSDTILSLSESFKAGGFSALFDDLAVMAEGLPEKLAESFLGLQDTFINLYDIVNNALAENLPTMIESGLEFLVGFSGSLRENAGLLVDGALAMVQTIADGIIQNIPTIIETIPTIITNIAGIINDNAPKLIATAASIIANLAVGLVKAIPTLVKNIPQIIEAIVAVFMAFNWINLGKNIITALKDGIASMIASVKTVASDIVSNINGTISQLPAALKASGSNAIQALINGIKSLIGSVGGAIKQIATTVLNGVKSLPSQFIDIGKNIVQGLIDGITGMFGGIGNAITNLGSTVLNKAKNVFGIHSPSTVMRDTIGKNLVLGVIDGVNMMANQLVNAIVKPVETAKNKVKNVGLAKGITDTINKAIEEAKTEAKSYSEVGDVLVSAIQNTIDENKDNILEEMQSLIDETVEQMADGEQKEKAKEAGQELMDSYKSALAAGADEAKAYVSEKIKSITDDFQSQYDELISKQEALEDVLGGTYLFEVEDGEVFVEDVQKSIDTLNAYGEAIENLKEKGASAALLDEISRFDPEQGIAVAEKLLEMSDEDFEALQEAWAEKQELSAELAREFYQDQMDILKSEFSDSLMNELDTVPDKVYDIGIDTVDGWMNGMNDKLPSLLATARDMAQKVLSEMKEAMGIESPSKETKYLGAMTSEGFAVGIKENIPKVKAAVDELNFFEAVKSQIPLLKSAVANTLYNISPVQSYSGSTSVRTESVQTINRNTVQTVKIEADQKGIFKLVQAESKRIGNSYIEGSGII